MTIKQKLLPFFAAVLCAWAMAVGNIMCLVTAFDITVSAKDILAGCGIFAIIWSGLFSLERRWPAWAVLTLTAVLVLFPVARALVIEAENTFIDALFATVQPILDRFIDTFSQLSSVKPITYVPAGTDATLFLSAVGFLITFLTCRTIQRQASVLPITVLSGLLLAICFIIIQTTPSAWCLVLLIWSYLILAICRAGRAHLCGSIPALTAAIPAAALLLVLLIAVDPDYYDHPDWADEARDRIGSFVERAFGAFSSVDAPFIPEGTLPPLPEVPLTPLGGTAWNRDVSKIDLTAVGRRIPNSTAVMTVEASRSGTLYLRGSSLGVYDGAGWTQLPESQIRRWNQFDPVWLAVEGSSSAETVSITTVRPSSVLYLPYWLAGLPEGYELFGDVNIINGAGLSQYTVSYFPDAPAMRLPYGYTNFVHNSAYIQLPEETGQAFTLLSARLAVTYGVDILTLTADEAARLVADFVSSSARYDLNTPAMPEGADFVWWFLNESDTGYCVHFASAAAVLLRCMRVPTRLVTGYMVNAVAGQRVTVTQDNAHAWVEYYVDGYGWKILEATPGYSDPSPDTTQPVAPDDPTEPIETRPPVETELPIETEAPTEQPTETQPGESPVDPLPGGDPGNGGAFQLPPAVKGILTGVLIAVLSLAFLFCVIYLTRRLWLSRGGVNVRAVRYYKQIVFLSRLTSQPVPKDALRLVQAARFGPRELTPEELTQLTSLYAALRERAIKKQGRLKGLLCRFILPW